MVQSMDNISSETSLGRQNAFGWMGEPHYHFHWTGEQMLSSEETLWGGLYMVVSFWKFPAPVLPIGITVGRNDLDTCFLDTHFHRVELLRFISP